MAYFPENGSFTERLQNVIQNDLPDTKQNILYIHEGINGALAQSSDKELPSGLFEPFDKVLVGHYHNRTRIKRGLPLNTSVQAASITSEKTKKKGYTLLYEDGSHEFIKNQVNIRYKTLDIAVLKGKHQPLQSAFRNKERQPI